MGPLHPRYHHRDKTTVEPFVDLRAGLASADINEAKPANCFARLIVRGEMMASGALAGVKVLDMSRVLAAPLAGQFLGDLGAEVIKVERQGVGDEAREYGPPFLKDRNGAKTTDAAFYLSCNRNK